MPTENERKFLLHEDSEKIFKNKAHHIKHIRQGYLGFSKGMSLRIRETNNHRYTLTFKQKVNNRVVEIEKKMDKRDFEDLWTVSVNKLEKIRYDINFFDYDNNPYLWEVDAFKDHEHKTYIIIAEHEMPEGDESPHFIPDLISENLIYSVPDSDDRFASKKVADVKYAKKLYESLIKKLDLISSL